MAMGTGQWETQQEQRAGDGKEREEQGKSPGAMQSTKEGAFSKGCANSGARTGLGSSWELASGREKKKITTQEHPSVLSLSSLRLPGNKAMTKPLPSRVMKTYDLQARKITLLMPGNCILII